MLLRKEFPAMKFIRTFSHKLLLACGLLLTVISQALAAPGDPASVAFYYGANPPANSLSQFDRLVLESENLRPSDLGDLKQHGSDTFAYLSIGEVNPQRSWADLIKPEWTLGENTDWNSLVMDMTNTGWHNFVLQRVDLLLQQGFDGLFLDTMDSYQLYSKDQASLASQQAALANLIQKIKLQHPSIKLISNRGFEVMDKIGKHLEAVAAESLYSRWNNAAGSYQPVPESDRQWLQAKLTEAKNAHNIDAIAIDYVAPSDRSKARDIAKKIASLGFIPWVANPSLDYVGVSNLEVIPREVIMIYDSGVNGPIEEAEVHALLAMPLEYMGYVPVYHNLATDGLPQGTLKGAYAGVVMWNRNIVKDSTYPAWLARHLDDKLPLAMFGSIGTELTGSLSAKLGIKPVSNIDPFTLKPVANTSLIGFEAPVPARIDQFGMSIENNDPNNTSHLRFEDKYGESIDTVITAPWGGLAIHPTILDLGLDSIKSWIINPFEFLKTSLQLVDAPMPDITSENGTRLWFAHIDGDAMPSWAELPGRQLGSEIIRDKIIKHYELPHTISVVEAEMYTPDRQERMEKTARDLFALDYVEIATHTYSHPFHWQRLRKGSPSGEHNLSIPEYRFDLDREIGGSATYIDTNLAPQGKKTTVLLWSGDAIPLADALATADKYGLINMNGGNTVISKSLPTVSAISANVRTVGGWTQIYAPIMNENVFTNEWLGPFDGFRRVIETLEMTEHPRRIKPANVYYHFYAGTKKASLRSLEEIYDWSMQQDILPVLSSVYILKVPNFRTAGVARHLDGRWKVSGLGTIKSLRTLKKNSFPDLGSTQSLIGTRETHDATYIHTNGANTVTFRMNSSKPQQIHLVAANALVKRWERRSDNTISMRLTGDLPVSIELGGDLSGCDFTAHGKTIRGKSTPEGNTRFNLSKKDTGDAIIDCKT